MHCLVRSGTPFDILLQASGPPPVGVGLAVLLHIYFVQYALKTLTVTVTVIFPKVTQLLLQEIGIGKCHLSYILQDYLDSNQVFTSQAFL